VNLFGTGVRYTSMMRNAWLVRVNACFLAVLLAGGGSGLPLVDALFHHLHGSTEAPVRLSGDADGSHAERCSLGVAAPAMDRAADAPSATLSAAILSADPAALPAQLLLAGQLDRSSAPRAPPAFIA